MCTLNLLEWAFDVIYANREKIKGKRVLEVGSRYVNGSVRPFIEKIGGSKEYIGVDAESGKNVDVVLEAEGILKHFGEEAFDMVISTEVLEHVYDWRKVINNLKKVLAPNGYLMISTRTYGFEYHGYPRDYWRFEVEDFREIFGDFDILDLRGQPEEKGIYLFARKPEQYREKDLSDISLYSMSLGKRTLSPSEISGRRKFLLGLRKIGLIKSVV